jgi:hypothetical protein
MSKAAAAAAPLPTPQQVIDLCNDDDSLERCNEAILGVARLPTNHETISLLGDDDVRESPLRTLRKRRHEHEKENDRNNPGRSTPDASLDKKQATRKSKRGTLKVPPAASAGVTAAKAPVVLDLEQPGAAAAAAMPTTTMPWTPPRTPLEEVMEVFPDIHPDHAQGLIRQHGNPLTVVSILAETDYPKSKVPVSFVDDGGVILHRDKRKREYQYDYMTASSFEPTSEYMAQAHTQICQDFPFISVNGSRKLLTERGKGHYAICYDEICKGIMEGSLSKDDDEQEEQYRLLKSAMSGVPLSEKQHTRLMSGR